MNDEQKKLAEENISLVHKYIYGHHLVEDVYYDILLIALCDAAINYNPSFGYTFSTFAFKCFDNAVRIEIRKENSPTHKCPGTMLYLDKLIDDDQEDDLYFCVSSGESSPENIAIQKSFLEDIFSCCINAKEIQVIKLIHMGYNFEEIGKKMGCSREWIRRGIVKEIRKRYEKKFKISRK